MIDLQRGVLEAFAERAAFVFDLKEPAFRWALRFDNATARDLTHEASFVEAARTEPGQESWRCADCGAEVVQRAGAPRPLHMGGPAVTLLCNSTRKAT